MPLEKDKSILVTGGTGLVGSYLLRLLIRKGFTKISALKRASSPMDLVADIESKINWIECDILEIVSLEEALKGIQQVYHCAGVVTFNPKLHQNMMEVNRFGTENLVNAALFEGVEKLIHVSSIAAIGRRPKLPIITEKTDWEKSKWNSAYAISKYLGEMEVWRGAAEGLKVAVVNPSVILGGGFWNKGTGQLFQRVWNGLKFYPKGSTGYVDVRDVTKFMIQLMNSDIENERFILNGANLNYLDFFTQIADVLSKKPPSIKVNFLLRELAILSDILRATFTNSARLITRHSANHVSRDFHYENKKSLTALDSEYTPIEKTIREIGELFLKNKKSKKVGILK